MLTIIRRIWELFSTRFCPFKLLQQVDLIRTPTLEHEIRQFDNLNAIRHTTENSPINAGVARSIALLYLSNMGAYSSLKRALVGISLTAREELKDDNIIVSVVYPYITLTDFEKNTIKHFSDDSGAQEGDIPLHGNSAEYAAQRILEAIEKEEAEIFAHDWMRKRALLPSKESQGEL